MGMLSEEKDKGPRSVAEAKKTGETPRTLARTKSKKLRIQIEDGKSKPKNYLNKGGKDQLPHLTVVTTIERVILTL
jgi:hypothetical protein